MSDNPRISVPPEVSAAGPTPPPSQRQTLPTEDNSYAVPLPYVLIGLAVLLGGFIYFLSRDTPTTVDFAEQNPSIEFLEEQSSSSPGVTQTTTDSIASSPSATTAPPSTAPAKTVPPTTAPPTTAALPASVPAETPAASPAPTEPLTGPPLRETGTVRHAVLAGGVVYLRGEVPSAEFGGAIVGAVEQVVGPGNVVDQYQIDPEAEAAGSAPLYVSDTVLFPSYNATINPAFFPILDLGSTLLQQNDAVKIQVIAHTDSLGGDQLNQSLSQLRADAVRQYWLDQGFAPERIEAIGRGEGEPIASNQTPEGRQANRRAEFVVIGILG